MLSSITPEVQWVYVPLATRNADSEYVVPAIRDGKRLDIDIEGNDIFICVTLAKEITTLFTLPSMQWPQSEVVTNWLEHLDVPQWEDRIKLKLGCETTIHYGGRRNVPDRVHNYIILASQLTTWYMRVFELLGELMM